MNVLLIGIFGVAGVFSRYGLDIFFSSRLSFPTGTLVANILGCFAAGLIYVLGAKEFFSPQLQVALLVGFCGGFTTFSAYALQTLIFYERGQMNLMLTNLLLNPALGFLALYAGYYGARFLIR